MKAKTWLKIKKEQAKVHLFILSIMVVVMNKEFNDKPNI